MLVLYSKLHMQIGPWIFVFFDISNEELAIGCLKRIHQ